MQPFLVQIVGGATSLKDWLPLASSLVIASAAYTGVIVSNRTNLRAITAADAREHTKWRRETLLRLSSEAVEHALTVQACYTKLVHLPLPPDPTVFDKIRDESRNAEIALNGTAAALGMLGAAKASTACGDLYLAATDTELLRTAGNLINAKTVAEQADPQNPSPKSAVHTAEQAFKVKFDQIDIGRKALIEAAGEELTALDNPTSADQPKAHRGIPSPPPSATGSNPHTDPSDKPHPGPAFKANPAPTSQP
ncbi:hypothetical protein [Nocardia sp. N2S4-5]|uniref:hypothetical protein n=1 Tax=Nocardia sp. N2S4-5 TaxID=3351565 RepID=UPI0037D63F31